MAKILDPFGAREARGSVGGITASKGRFGQILRAKRSPVQPRSHDQQQKRFLLQSLVQHFITLDQTYITAWNDFAKNWTVTDSLGQSIHLTGLNWFIALNSRLVTLSSTPHDAPPLNPNCAYNPVILAQQAAGGDPITITFDTVPTAWQAIWCRWSDALPKTSSFKKKSLRQRLIIRSTDTSPKTAILYANLIPTISRYQFELFSVDEYGRAGAIQRFDVYPVPA